MKTFISGKMANQGHYNSFQPNNINRDWQIEDMSVFKLLSIADRQLGRLDMYSHHVNIDLFTSMHIAKEATQSSKIEGTQTNIEEAFLEREEIALEKRNDWEEVQNYIEAMNNAVELLTNLPFSARLIKTTHKILLQGVRGETRAPGEFGKSQNWIGGATLNDAVFIPPVHTAVPELISDLEKFANDDLNPMPDLLKIALIHYQFETIHPFLDGNGRIGRLLITLYSVSKGILKQPILYLSDFFERNRMLYYDNLMRVRAHNDLNQWLKFFLAGVAETAKNGVNTLESIFRLQKETDIKITALRGKALDGKKVVEYLYKRPVIQTTDIEKIIQKTSVSAYNLTAELEKLGILKEITGGQRKKIYAFKDYLDILKNNNTIAEV